MGAGGGASVACKALRTNPLESADSSDLPGFFFFFSDHFLPWKVLPASISANLRRESTSASSSNPLNSGPESFSWKPAGRGLGPPSPNLSLPLPLLLPAEPWNPVHCEGARQRLGVPSLETAPSRASSQDHMTSADREALEVDPEHHSAK